MAVVICDACQFSMNSKGLAVFALKFKYLVMGAM